MKTTCLFLLTFYPTLMTWAGSEQNTTLNKQEKDTIEVQIGENSRVIIQVENREELEKLKQYDLNKMVSDLEETLNLKNNPKHIAIEDSTGEKYLQNKPESKEFKDLEDAFKNHQDGSKGSARSNDQYYYEKEKRYVAHRTKFISLLDLGMNNYLEDGQGFPDENNAPYTVKPWGSWYVSIAPTWQTNLAGPFSLDYGTSISWYNFKFQDNATKILKGDENVIFESIDPELNPIKSKLTAAYLGLHLVPVFDFGYKTKVSQNSDGTTRKRTVFYHSNSFRIGLGMYAGYRLDSYSKNVYKDGNKNKDRNHDNFYLNNFRYGTRLVVGIGDVDLFINYDLNELFAQDRGPRLNAFSFGLSF